MARSMTESMEQWGPQPRPLAMSAPDGELVEQAVAEGRGLVVLTGHFGSWEVGARMLATLGRPVNWVMAPNRIPTVRDFVHEMRTRHGFKSSTRPLHAERSTGLHALRRGEIVCMQIEPWRGHRGTHPVTFCGRRTRFQLGPFVLARLAQAPIVPAFLVRRGIRRYEFRIPGRYDPRTPRECEHGARSAVHGLRGARARASRTKWIMFEDVWADARRAAPAYEMVPQASGLRRR
jgi:KDO2-lipid IV(A) lauroyltransferase